MNIFGNKEPPDFEETSKEVITEFRYKAALMVAQGDLAGVKNLFVHTLADLRAAHQEEQLKANVAMRDSLQEILLEPSQHVRRGWFEDL